MTALPEGEPRGLSAKVKGVFLAKEAAETKRKAPHKRQLPIRKHCEERENGIASAVPFSHFSIDAVTFDISKAPMPL